MEQKIFYSNSDDYAREYYDSLLIEPRYVGAEEADLSVEYFGKRFSSPIMIAPMVCSADAVTMAKASQKTNTLFWGAHLMDEQISTIAKMGVSVVATCKPLADHEAVKDRIRKAEELGATAFFIDIDHIFSPKTGEFEKMPEGQLGRQSFRTLAEYAACTKLPVLMKGILSPRDALLSKEAGIAGIVVSHHHGMLQYSVPPAYALQTIRKSVGRDYPVFIDCGIESGIDAFKALALGADGVLVARDLMPHFKEGGALGGATRLEAMNTELRYYMDITGSSTVKKIDPDVLVRMNW